jgi:hypothetical protein
MRKTFFLLLSMSFVAFGSARADSEHQYKTAMLQPASGVAKMQSAYQITVDNTSTVNMELNFTNSTRDLVSNSAAQEMYDNYDQTAPIFLKFEGQPVIVKMSSKGDGWFSSWSSPATIGDSSPQTYTIKAGTKIHFKFDTISNPFAFSQNTKINYVKDPQKSVFEIIFGVILSAKDLFQGLVSGDLVTSAEAMYNFANTTIEDNSKPGTTILNETPQGVPQNFLRNQLIYSTATDTDGFFDGNFYFPGVVNINVDVKQQESYREIFVDIPVQNNEKIGVATGSNISFDESKNLITLEVSQNPYQLAISQEIID